MPDILEKTIAREVMEEVGLTLTGTPRYVNSSSFVTDRGEAVVDIVFLCEYESGEPRIASAEEVASVCWMTAEEVLRHPLSPPWLKRNLHAAGGASEAANATAVTDSAARGRGNAEWNNSATKQTRKRATVHRYNAEPNNSGTVATAHRWRRETEQTRNRATRQRSQIGTE